jgi:hypothetical protein
MPTPLDERYAFTVKRIRARVTDYLLTQFRAGHYRDRDLQRFVQLAVPVVLAGQRQVSALTDAYLANVLTTTLGRPVRPVGVTNDYPRGVDPGEVYARPFVTVRTKLSEEKPLQAAISAGAARLVDIVATDMQLSKTHTARRAFTSSGVQRYRRVLTGSVNCALCTIASTQLYWRGDLLPIHPGCDCSVAPVSNPDAFDQDAELEKAHEDIGARFGKDAVDRGGRDPLDYRKAVIVRDHGEIGRVLTLAEHQFTGPAAI